MMLDINSYPTDQKGMIYLRVYRKGFTMFTIIIITLVVAFAIGFLKNMTANERAIVMSRTLNATKYGVTGVVKVGKSTIKATYQSGQIAGMQMALEGQDTLASMHEFNKNVTANGGAVKIAVEDINKLSVSMGLDTVNADLARRIAEMNVKLAEARARTAQ